jgi:hypothetical protein
VIDTGASWSVTPHLSDFCSDLKSCDFEALHSLDADIAVHGVGTVEWTVQDIHGNVRKIQCESLYVPTAAVRLFSPQSYFRETQRGQLTATKDYLLLTLFDSFTLTFPWDHGSNMPFMFSPAMCAHLDECAHQFVGLTQK